MYRSFRIHTHAKIYICLIAAVLCLFATSVSAYAATSNNSVIPMDRYDYTTSVQSAQTQSGSGVISDPEVLTGEAIAVEYFNGRFLDTVIYVLGGLAGFMMILQIAAYCVCRIFPTLNDLVAKLQFIGITGYETNILVFCLKVGLLGMLSYFCLSGIMKRIIVWVMGFITNIFL